MSCPVIRRHRSSRRPDAAFIRAARDAEAICALRRTSADSEVVGPGGSSGGMSFPGEVSRDHEGRDCGLVVPGNWRSNGCAGIAGRSSLRLASLSSFSSRSLRPWIAAAVDHSPEAQFRETGLSPSGIPVGPSRAFLFGTDGLGVMCLCASSMERVCRCWSVFLPAGWRLRWARLLGSRRHGLADVIDTILFAADGRRPVPSVSGLRAGARGGRGTEPDISIVVIAFFSWASVGRVVRGAGAVDPRAGVCAGARARWGQAT